MAAATTAKKDQKPKTEPTKENLHDDISAHLKSKYHGCMVKFLWNKDDCYRFRINHFITDESGKTYIDRSFFVHATPHNGNIKVEEKKEDPNSRAAKLRQLGLL